MKNIKKFFLTFTIILFLFTLSNFQYDSISGATDVTIKKEESKKEQEKIEQEKKKAEVEEKLDSNFDTITSATDKIEPNDKDKEIKKEEEKIAKIEEQDAITKATEDSQKDELVKKEEEKESIDKKEDIISKATEEKREKDLKEEKIVFETPKIEDEKKYEFTKKDGKKISEDYDLEINIKKEDKIVKKEETREKDFKKEEIEKEDIKKEELKKEDSIKKEEEVKEIIKEEKKEEKIVKKEEEKREEKKKEEKETDLKKEKKYTELKKEKKEDKEKKSYMIIFKDEDMPPSLMNKEYEEENNFNSIYSYADFIPSNFIEFQKAEPYIELDDDKIPKPGKNKISTKLGDEVLKEAINFLKSNSFKNAKLILNKLIYYNYQLFDCYYYLHHIYFLEKDYDLSIKYINKAIEYGEKNNIDLAIISDYYYYKANSYYCKKDFENSINNLIIALEKNSSNYKIYNLLGLSYYYLGDYKKALDNWGIGMKNNDLDCKKNYQWLIYKNEIKN